MKSRIFPGTTLAAHMIPTASPGPMTSRRGSSFPLQAESATDIAPRLIRATTPSFENPLLDFSTQLLGAYTTRILATSQRRGSWKFYGRDGGDGLRGGQLRHEGKRRLEIGLKL